MSNAVFFNAYKLKKGSSVPDFLLANEQLICEYASKQKGFISTMLMADGDLWAKFRFIVIFLLKKANDLEIKVTGFIEFTILVL